MNPNKRGRYLSKSQINPDKSYILSSQTAFPIVEEYKTIRTNIEFSIPEDGCRVIAITSAEMMAGKSINCLNLAIAFSETTARVLLIDCDLRIPKIAQFLAMENTSGISNVLVGQCSLNDAIIKSPYAGLDVITSGKIPPNPSELLGSGKMRNVLDELKKHYDYILIDTPPVNAVSDVLVLSKYLSGIVIIVRSGFSEKEAVREAVNKLKFVKANILGFVLNATPVNNSKYYKSYYKKIHMTDTAKICLHPR